VTPSTSPRRPAARLIAIAIFVCLAALAAWTAPAHTQSTPQRIVAIGDIHGSYEGLTAILERAGLVNEGLRWSGGRATVVQTGDYTDRGADVRKVMDLLMRLEKEARSAGGRFVVLAGNHEMMNLVGDLRDVTPEICAAFATPKSDARREEAWRQYERVARARAGALTPAPAVYTKTREAWLDAHPPGCLEYREAMGPGGSYGRWLREKDIALVVGNTLFMHAGLNPSRPAPTSIAEVNDRARAEVRRFDSFRRRLVDRGYGLPFFDLQDVVDVGAVEIKLAVAALATARADGTQPVLDLPLVRQAQDMMEIGKWSLVDPEGPLWFRGYAAWPEETTTTQVATFLDRLKLARIVVGHTVTSDRRITTRYGGRVIAIDTGMLAPVYMGNPSALEITGDRLRAIYPDGEVDLTARAAGQ
jgi:hypothetical protein